MWIFCHAWHSLKGNPNDISEMWESLVPPWLDTVTFPGLAAMTYGAKDSTSPCTVRSHYEVEVPKGSEIFRKQNRLAPPG